MNKPTKRPAPETQGIEATTPAKVPDSQTSPAEGALDMSVAPAADHGSGSPPPTYVGNEAESAEPCEAGGGAIQLPEILDLPRAGDLYEQLAACNGQPVRLEVGGVTFIGTSAFQVLLTAAAAWQAAGVTFEISELSEGFLACAARLGLSPETFMQGDPA